MLFHDLLPVVILFKLHLHYNLRHGGSSLFSVQSNTIPGFAVHSSLLSHYDHKASCYLEVLELHRAVVGPSSVQKWAVVLLEYSKNKSNCVLITLYGVAWLGSLHSVRAAVSNCFQPALEVMTVPLHTDFECGCSYLNLFRALFAF